MDDLTTNVVTLQELLGDKRSRGAFGEVQLEALVRNVLPPQAFAMQYTLPNGTRTDCVLKLPSPRGSSPSVKFPLGSYHRMLADGASKSSRAQARKRLFKTDLKRHVDDIGRKYVIPDVTSDGAVMFVPAEALVFAEIHAYHADLVEYAQRLARLDRVADDADGGAEYGAGGHQGRRDTARNTHIIKDEHRQARARVRPLRRAHAQAGGSHPPGARRTPKNVQVTSQKISQRFAQIETSNLPMVTCPPSRKPRQTSGAQRSRRRLKARDALELAQIAPAAGAGRQSLDAGLFAAVIESVPVLRALDADQCAQARTLDDALSGREAGPRRGGSNWTSACATASRRRLPADSRARLRLFPRLVGGRRLPGRVSGAAQYVDKAGVVHAHREPLAGGRGWVAR
ncbi:MAG: DNA recombination protein RmuC [Burkholderiales bacterium]